MSGLGIQLDFTSTRVLSDIEMDHVKQAQMTYLGLYGQSATETVRNRSKGDLVTPSLIYMPENQVLGENYMASTARDLSAGINSTGQPKQLNQTLFAAFNSGDVQATTGSTYGSAIISAWGDNPATNSNPGRLSIGLFRTQAGEPYIAMRWGTGANVPALACAVPFEWMNATGPILAIGSRSETGAMALEVRVDGAVLKASAQVTPVAIPAESGNWRLYIGQLSTYPIDELRMYAAAAWAGYLTAEELTSELNVMEINLLGHLS